MLDRFTQHPRSVGESYGEHFRNAVSFSFTMFGAGLACLVHAVLPFLFERTASTCIHRLSDRMQRRVDEAAKHSSVA